LEKSIKHRRDFLVPFAKNRGLSKQLVSKAVNEDLGYRSYRMAKHILTAYMKATRLTNGK
ncbi:Uncharacterized protein FKW44_022602, partial [Caligus rogercresseyi]